MKETRQKQSVNNTASSIKKGIEGSDARTVKANNIVTNNPICLFQPGDATDKRLFRTTLIVVDVRRGFIEIIDSKAVDFGKIMQAGR